MFVEDKMRQGKWNHCFVSQEAIFTMHLLWLQIFFFNDDNNSQELVQRKHFYKSEDFYKHKSQQFYEDGFTNMLLFFQINTEF